MCRLIDRHDPQRYTEDDERVLQTFAHYSRGRTREETRRLWAQLGGKAAEWDAKHPEEDNRWPATTACKSASATS